MKKYYITKRDTYTICLWTLFIANLVFNHLLIPNDICQNPSAFNVAAIFADVVSLLIFQKFMWVRKRYLDNPEGSWKCHFGIHDYVETKEYEIAFGPGEYLGETEIHRKRRFTDFKCTRCSNSFTN